MNDITAHIVVPQDHPSLAGHFPGHPIVPGVVLLDAVLDTIRAHAPDRPVRLESIVSTKFLQGLEPERRLDLEIRLARERAGAWKARFVGSHDGATVLEGSLLLVEEPEAMS